MNFLHRIKSKRIRALLNFLMITVGCAVYACGVFMFLDPNALVSGGMSGFSIILSHTIGIFPTGTWIILINIPLMLLAVWKFGFKFVLSTVYAIAISSVFMNFGSKYIGAVTNDLFLASLAGPTMVAIGIGLLFRAGASTGGTDILVKLIKLKFKAISTGTIFMICDCVIITCSLIAFRRVDLSLYAIVCVIIQTIVLDKILYGFDSAKMMYIVSHKNSEISSRLLKELDVGTTMVHSHGGYTGKDFRVIMCVLKKQLLPNAKDIVREEDDNAFVIVTTASEVLGEGYKSHHSEDL